MNGIYSFDIPDFGMDLMWPRMDLMWPRMNNSPTMNMFIFVAHVSLIATSMIIG